MDNISENTRDVHASHASFAALSVSRYSWSSLLSLAVAVYLLLASSLRFRRIDAVKRKYGFYSRDSLAKMTDNEAHEILNFISDLEFPTMFEKGLQLALFRSILHYTEFL